MMLQWNQPNVSRVFMRMNIAPMFFGARVYAPRLSAAITMPSLYFVAMTDVPVTAGDCVCVIGPDAADEYGC